MYYKTNGLTKEEGGSRVEVGGVETEEWTVIRAVDIIKLHL